MTPKRQITEPRLNLVASEIKSFRFRVQGGEGTTGDHYVTFMQDDGWHCDCQGFATHKKCRHVKAGEILVLGMERSLEKIEECEEENWL